MLNELEALARAVYASNKDDWELKQALLHFDRAANPRTILRLIELVREMGEVLDKVAERLWMMPKGQCDREFLMCREALAKFKELTK